MREIKFRGRFWNKDNLDASECEYRDGEFIYGGYARLKNICGGTGDYIVAASGIGHLVYPDSVAQLIGHDSNGREVYEGDTLFDETGNEYTATLDLVIAWTDEKTGALQTISIDNAKKFTKLTLVEAA